MTWSARRERGSPVLLRVALFLLLRGGRPLEAALAAVATTWFLLTAPAARRASRDYLGRVLGRPVRFGDVARHFHAFARAVIDRVLLLGGRGTEFRVQTEGLDAVLSVLGRGQGCILLGAHHGSFEVLRRVAAAAPVPVWALMYRRNGGALTALLDQLAPELRERILPIGDTASMIRAHECVERGEIVGILADRAPPDTRTVPASFLGGTAPFPAGPFILAGTLAAPVVLFHAVRTGYRRYVVRFTPFAERVVLRRGSREADLRAQAAAFAAALEPLCRRYPWQWFNFFPFWTSPADASTASPPPPPAQPPARRPAADLVRTRGR